MRTAIAAVVLSAALAALCPAGEIKLTSIGPRQIAVELPGGTAKLTLAKCWGRTRGADRPWTLEGDRLPTLVARSGDGWVEVNIPAKTEKVEDLRIFQVELDLSSATDWNDANGKRTILRRGPKWVSAAELLARQALWPERWSWPVGAGRLAGVDKNAGAPERDDHWTGFSTEQYKGQTGPQEVADVPVVLRRGPDDKLLGLGADYALAVGYDGAVRLRICPLVRGLKAGHEQTVTVRLWLASGRPEDLGAKWAAESDRLPLRVAFCGDSVGAAQGSYANQAIVRLFDEFGGKVRAINTSRGGATTKEFLDVWQPRVMDYNPNLVVFQLSYNDAFNGSNRLTPENVVSNYRTMIDSVLAKSGGRVVVLTPLSFDKPRLDAALANGEGQRYSKGTDLNQVAATYIAAIEKMVAGYQADAKGKNRVSLVNIFAAMATVRAEKGADHRLLGDGSHPNKDGDAVIFDALWPELKRAAEATLKEMEEKR